MKKIAIFIVFLLIFLSPILNAEQITANLLKEVNFSQTKITATQEIKSSIINKKSILHKKNYPIKNHSITYPNVKINSKIQHISSNTFFTTTNKQLYNKKILFSLTLLVDNVLSVYDDFILSNPDSNQDFLYWFSFWKILQKKYWEHRKILVEKQKERIILVDLWSNNNEVLDKSLFQNYLNLFSISVDRVGDLCLKILSRSFKDYTMFKLTQSINSCTNIKDNFFVQSPITNLTSKENPHEYRPVFITRHKTTDSEQGV